MDAETRRTFLAHIPENSPVGIAAIDRDGTVSYVNPFLEQLYRYAAHEILGQPWQMLCGDEVCGSEAVFDQVRRDGFWRGEDLRRRKDGELFHSSSSITEVHDGDGRFVCYSDVSRDITARRRVEARLRQSEHQYRGIFEGVSDALIVFDAQGRIVQANTAAHLLVERDAHELEGMDGARLFHPASAGVFEALCAQDRGRAGFHSEARVVREGAAEIDVDLRGSTFVYRGEPHFLAALRDISSRKRMEEELRRLAVTDPLTTAFNRRHFTEIGREEVYRAGRYDRPLSLAMLDLDHFKRVNDLHGHATGDAVLVQVTKTCLETLRGSDLFARLGGEEFAVLMPETDSFTARDVSERLRGFVSESSVFSDDRKTVRFTASIGVASLAGHDDTLQGLMKRADEALFRAKQRGRNRVVQAS